MATLVKVDHPRRFDWIAAAVAFGLSMPTGYLLMRFALPVAHDRYLPWIVGRACGLAAYFALVVLVVFGMWLRHPWRHRFRWPHPEDQFRLHAAMGVAVVALVGAHIVALVLDRYAGVSWLAVVVPFKATYRPTAVTIGVFALYGLTAITLTARVGGRAVGRQWRRVHSLALPTLALAWFHGVYAGTDSPRLRLCYLLTGLLVVAVAATRAFATARVRTPANAAPPAPLRAVNGGRWSP
jgi:sulfoxide reductase heme-binding subunit YedZ